MEVGPLRRTVPRSPGCRPMRCRSGHGARRSTGRSATTGRTRDHPGAPRQRWITRRVVTTATDGTYVIRVTGRAECAVARHTRVGARVVRTAPVKVTARGSLPGREHVRRDALPLLQGVHLLRAFLRRSLSVATLVALDLSALTSAFSPPLPTGSSGPAGRLRGDLAGGAPGPPIASVTLVLVFARARLYHERDREDAPAPSWAASRCRQSSSPRSSWPTATVHLVLQPHRGLRHGERRRVALRASHASLTSLIFDILRAGGGLCQVRPDSPGDLEQPRNMGPRGIRTCRQPVQFTGNGNEISPGLRRESARAGRRVISPDGADAPLSNSGVLPRQRCGGRMAPPRPNCSHSLTVAARSALFAVHPPVLSGSAFFIKRAFDVIVGSIILLLVSPILLIAALAIKIEDGGPVIFRSRRVGVDETRFDCLKLRTMSIDAEQKQADLEGQNEADGALFKIKADPRVARGPGAATVLDRRTHPAVQRAPRRDVAGRPPSLPERDFDLLDRSQAPPRAPGMTGLWSRRPVGPRSTSSCDAHRTSSVGQCGRSRHPLPDIPRPVPAGRVLMGARDTSRSGCAITEVRMRPEIRRSCHCRWAPPSSLRPVPPVTRHPHAPRADPVITITPQLVGQLERPSCHAQRGSRNSGRIAALGGVAKPGE